MNPAMPWIEHLMQDEGLTYAQAREMLEGYECVPYVENGEHMATLIKKNAEVHFAGFKQYRGKGYITRRRLREFLQPILDKEGFLTTKLAEGEPDKFITKLGFVEVGRSTSHRVFMLTSIKPLEKPE
jgi:hypothetical protein